jgi:hypothetical protein
MSVYSINNNLFNSTLIQQTTPSQLYFNSETITGGSLHQYASTQNMETGATARFSRAYNPLISYDYKCGHYLGIWDQLYPSLITSYIEVARGIRKAS